MTRMTVVLDEKIVSEARDLLKTKTKRETIETALIEVINEKKLYSTAGRLNWISIRKGYMPIEKKDETY